jgi:hypothetical protein
MDQLCCRLLIPHIAATLLAASVLAAGWAGTSTVAIELGSKFGEFSVVNRGGPISLNSTVTVERLANGKWVRASVTNLYLRETCDAKQPARCTRLEPGQVIKAARWTGNFCSSQCPSPCRLDGPAPAGTYRFSVTACDGKETFSSSEFKKE